MICCILFRYEFCLQLVVFLAIQHRFSHLIPSSYTELNLSQAVQKDGRNAAHSAARYGHLEVLAAISCCEGGPDMIFAEDKNKRTPVRFLCLLGEKLFDIKACFKTPCSPCDFQKCMCVLLTLQEALFQLHWVADSSSGAAKCLDDDDILRKLSRKKNKASGVAIVEFLCEQCCKSPSVLAALRQWNDNYSTPAHRALSPKKKHGFLPARSALAALKQSTEMFWVGDTSNHLLFRVDKHGRNALHLACRFGSEDLVAAILNQAERIGAKERLLKEVTLHGFTAMHSAARMGKHGIVEQLFKEGGEKVGPEITLAADNDGWTPLHYAIAKSKESHTLHIDADRKLTIKKLRKYAGDEGLDLVDKHGIIPLHLACSTNDVDLVKLFVDVSSTMRGAHGSPRVGLEGLKWKTVSAPPAHITWGTAAGMSSLLFAARAGAFKLIKMFCEEYKLDPREHVDADGRTPLHYASSFRRCNLVAYFIGLANLNGDSEQQLLFYTDKNKRTCLHVVCEPDKKDADANVFEMDQDDDSDEDQDNGDRRKELEMMEDGDELETSGGIAVSAHDGLTDAPINFLQSYSYARNRSSISGLSDAFLDRLNSEEVHEDETYLDVVTLLVEAGGVCLCLQQVSTCVC